MCAMASSRPSTTRTARIGARYSAAQSASLASRASAKISRVLRAAADLDALLVKCLQHRGHHRAGRGLVYEQRLQAVAHGHLPELRVEHDRPGHLRVGAGVEEDVADARVVLDHRDAGRLHDLADQARPAARNHQVDETVGPEQGLERRTVGGGHDHHGVLGNARIPRGRAQLLAERQVRPDRFRAAAQDHGVARLHAERGRVDRDVRSRLVDDEDDAERYPHAAHPQAIRSHPRLDDLAHGIRQRRHVAKARDHVAPLRIGEREPAEQRRLDAGGLGGAHVVGVGGEDAPARGFESLRAAQQPGVLLASAQRRHVPRRLPRTPRQLHHDARRGSPVRSSLGLPLAALGGVASLEQHQIVAVDHLVAVRKA